MYKRIVITIILFITYFSYAGLVNSQQTLDKIIAIVDDDIILQSELMQFSMSFAFQMKVNPQLEPKKFEEIQQEVLENMINQKILLVKAEEDTIEANEREVDNVLDDQIDRMVQQLGSVEKLEEYMGSPINKIRRDFRDEVRDNLKVEQLKALKMRSISISRREIEHFYKTMKDSLPDFKETVDISHILVQIKSGKEGEQEARQRIENILNQLNAGADFTELASKYSEDPGSKSRGGELGFFQRGEFVKEFEEVAFQLKPGEISGIVKSEHGFHIIQMIERRGEKINVRHILIRLIATEEDAQATERKVQDIWQQLTVQKKDFAELAKKYSDDETTREQGGHLGQFTVEDLQEKEFKRVLETLKTGEISKPFQTRFGWHILKLNSREEARDLSIEKDWEQIEGWALNLKQQEEFQKWVDELRKNTYIDIKQ